MHTAAMICPVAEAWLRMYCANRRATAAVTWALALKNGNREYRSIYWKYAKRKVTGAWGLKNKEPITKHYRPTAIVWAEGFGYQESIMDKISIEEVRAATRAKERQLLVSALENSGGNLSLAGRLLGCSRHSVMRRIAKYNLNAKPQEGNTTAP